MVGGLPLAISCWDGDSVRFLTDFGRACLVPWDKRGVTLGAHCLRLHSRSQHLGIFRRRFMQHESLTAKSLLTSRGPFSLKYPPM